MPPVVRKPGLPREPCTETVVLALICMLDLLTTLYWIARGHAGEGNPLMRWTLQAGPKALILAKLAAFVPSLLIAEWYRSRNPQLVRLALRGVIAAYCLLYLRSLVNQPGPADFLAGLGG